LSLKKKGKRNINDVPKRKKNKRKTKKYLPLISKRPSLKKKAKRNVNYVPKQKKNKRKNQIAPKIKENTTGQKFKETDRIAPKIKETHQRY
jgi:hypothetical protein